MTMPHIQSIGLFLFVDGAHSILVDSIRKLLKSGREFI